MAFVIIGFAAVVGGLILLWWLADRRGRLLGVVLALSGTAALYASRPSDKRQEELEARNVTFCYRVAGKLDVFRMTYDVPDIPGWASEKREEWIGIDSMLSLAIMHCVSPEAVSGCLAVPAQPYTPAFSANIDALIHGLETGLPCK